MKMFFIGIFSTFVLSPSFATDDCIDKAFRVVEEMEEWRCETTGEDMPITEWTQVWQETYGMCIQGVK